MLHQCIHLMLYSGHVNACIGGHIHVYISCCLNVDIERYTNAWIECCIHVIVDAILMQIAYLACYIHTYIECQIHHQACMHQTHICYINTCFELHIHSHVGCYIHTYVKQYYLCIYPMSSQCIRWMLYHASMY